MAARRVRAVNWTTEPERWLAVPGPGDSVRLLPVGPVAGGPDVFVKAADYEHLAEAYAALVSLHEGGEQ
jgi:hypothetical protein